MTSEPRPQFDIAIIGRGVRDVSHLTLESLAVLKSCNRGFVPAPTQEEVDLFRDSVLKHLTAAEALPPLVNLAVAYRPDRSQTDNCADAGEVVFEAAKLESPVAYLPPGNPVAWDGITQRILEGSRARGLRTKIVPGISFIDTMFADLEQEMAPGIQVYDASWAVGSALRLDARAGCVLLQIGLFCKNHSPVGEVPRTPAMEVLKHYLLRFYPSDHLVVLVRSQSGGASQPYVQPISLGELPALPGDRRHGASIYIPPLLAPPHAEEFAARMSKLEAAEPV